MLNIYTNKKEVIIDAQGSPELMVAELNCAIDKLITGITKKSDKFDRDLILDKMYESLVNTWRKEDEGKNNNISNSVSNTGATGEKSNTTSEGE